MLLKFGSNPVLIASSPEMAKEILKTHDAVFSSRLALTAGKYISFNHSDVSWAPYGAHWRQARKIYQTEIFSPKRLESFKYIRVEERRNLISCLHVLSGKQIFLRDHLTEFTLSTISRMVMSSTYHRDESIENLQGMLDEWFILGGVINIGDWIPWLNWLDLQGYIKRMKALDKKLREFFKYVLEDHKAKGKEDSVPKDMVDVLLQLVDGPNLEVKITTDNLMGLILDLLAGGTDTSATTIEWTFQELVRNPKMIEKANEELDRTIECNVAGYDIPKGTMVFINIWSLGKNPNYWNSPEEFIPEIFLENDINIKGKNFTMLPFLVLEEGGALGIALG
ncbi:hypothetical protein KY284_007930 [Solanum tuberosum]|nr:hypothetical protein KY284_007930 [Solanum tuberosum]